MKKILLLSVILTSLFLNGCACKEKIKYVYLKTNCPKLQTYDYNITKTKPLTLHIKVKNGKENDRNSSR